MGKIKKLLIANRGEIAIRIARTAADMNIDTVAIFTKDDANSLHIKYADEAAELKLAGVAGYLDIPSIIEIACATGCDAIHPGYGLLSERVDFAEACAKAGIIFVGPDRDTLAANGDKVAARSLAQRAGVAIIPGTSNIETEADVTAFFHETGEKPLMIKAVHGGGGRGMRIVRAEKEISPAFAQCKAEALASFGEDQLYVEQFLPRVRHIEVQIVGDGQDVIHLFERDCSVQRRNQKVVELAPAPGLTDETRTGLHEAAIRIGKACAYKGLGTVEFLVDVDSGEFFFIETNPRIQVEHTITEEITGLDLVSIQLAIAAGATLGELHLVQERFSAPNGCAIQIRINSEKLDPAGNIIPTGGQITGFQPASGPGVRVDTYAYSGYSTNPNFDNLIAKLIVHVPRADLKLLYQKTDRALSEFLIDGVDTNINLLRRLLGLDQLIAWDVNVADIDAKIRTLTAGEAETDRVRYISMSHAQSDQQLKSAKPLAIPEGAVAITAPMQAVIASISVKEGQPFHAGDELFVVEAMKMQHVITAKADGTVRCVEAAVGDLVAHGEVVLLVHEEEGFAQSAENETVVDLDEIRPDLQHLFDRQALTLDENRPLAVERRRARGQRTARENVAAIVDEGSFVEYGQLVYAAMRCKMEQDELQRISPADGIITGVGSVNGDLFDDKFNRVAVLSYDGTVMAGTQGTHGHHKTDRLLEVAAENELPIIFFAEGGGGRPNDDDFLDVARTGLNFTTFHCFARHKGVAPKITVVSGYCFAGNAALYAAGDIRVATRNSWIGLAGPAMIEAGGLGAFSPKEIGPAPMQAEIGLVDILVDDDKEAARVAKKALSYFQGPVREWEAADQRLLRHLVPENRKRVYDMREIVVTIADVNSFLEVRERFAPGMITGFLRIEGRPLGIIANNPGHLGGAINAESSRKASEFMKLCNKYRLPILSLCDTPGFMVGPQSEAEGGVKQAGEFMMAGGELEVPLVFVCTRKGYGIGAMAMAGGSFATPVVALSWPSGEFGAMGLEGGVLLGYRKELEAQPTPEAREALYQQLVEQTYAQGHALNVASLLEIDAVIDPAETRHWILQGLAMNK